MSAGLGGNGYASVILALTKGSGLSCAQGGASSRVSSSCQRPRSR